MAHPEANLTAQETLEMARGCDVTHGAGLRTVLPEDFRDNRCFVLGREARETKQQDSCSDAPLPKHDLSEVRVTCDEQAGLRLSNCQYAVISGARIRFGNPDNIMTVIAEATYDRRLDVLVCHKHESLR
jgi:hypothetical protein